MRDVAGLGEPGHEERLLPRELLRIRQRLDERTDELARLAVDLLVRKGRVGWQARLLRLDGWRPSDFLHDVLSSGYLQSAPLLGQQFELSVAGLHEIRVTCIFLPVLFCPGALLCVRRLDGVGLAAARQRQELLGESVQPGAVLESKDRLQGLLVLDSPKNGCEAILDFPGTGVVRLSRIVAGGVVVCTASACGGLHILLVNLCVRLVETRVLLDPRSR